MSISEKNNTMSMRVIEEKIKRLETNDGDWKKEIGGRLHRYRPEMVIVMMVDEYGIPKDEDRYFVNKNSLDGLMERVEVLEEKIKRLEN